jgi:hypothetical protein
MPNGYCPRISRSALPALQRLALNVLRVATDVIAHCASAHLELGHADLCTAALEALLRAIGPTLETLHMVLLAILLRDAGVPSIDPVKFNRLRASALQ